MSEAAAAFSVMANHVWQSALLAGLLAALLAGRSQLSAQTRHTLAFAALAAGALLPLAMLLPANATLMRLLSVTAGPAAPSEIVIVEAAPVTTQVTTPTVAPVAPISAERPARTARFDYVPRKGWRAYAAGGPSPSADNGGAGAQSEPFVRAAPAAPSPIDPYAALPAPTTDVANEVVSDAAASSDAAIAAAPQWTFDLHRRPVVLWSMIGLWLVVAAALLVRVVVDALAAERLRRRSTPVVLPRPLAHLVGDVDVRESAQAPGPMAAGLVQSSIILPTGFIAQHSPQELLGLLEHERTHVTRGDLRLALVQRILTALFWWSPAMHWISARVEEEREMACDEAAARRVGDARAFAKTLTEHAQAQLFWGWPRLVVGAARRRSQLGRRVRRLLDLATSRARPIELTARASVGVLLAAVAATALATPRLAAQDFEDEDDREAPRAEPAPDAPRAPRAPRAEEPNAEELERVAEEVERLEEALEAAQESFAEAQEELDEATQEAADDGSDEARDRVREARQELRAAQRDVESAAREMERARGEMERAFVTIEARGPNGWPGVSVDVQGPSGEEIDAMAEAAAEAAASWAASLSGLADGVEFNYDYDYKYGPNGVVIGNAPGFRASFGWSGANETPLLAAVRSGDLDMVRVLVDAGADVNAASASGSPLLAAVQSGSKDVVEYLLQSGADANQVVLGQGTPLMTAIRSGDRDMVRLLADNGARIDENSEFGETALITAVRSGDVDLVRLLIELGADVEGGASNNADDEDEG